MVTWLCAVHGRLRPAASLVAAFALELDARRLRSNRS